MANTTSAATGRAAVSAKSIAIKQGIRNTISGYLKEHFGSTLNSEPDMVNVFMSLIQRESSFRYEVVGVNYGSTHTKKILSYSAIATKYKTATAEERSNILSSCAGYGLAQVTGYYCIKGCSPSGVGELERMRSDIASPLMIEPGEDVGSVLLGDDNINNQILAGLIVLEYKYKSSYVIDLVKKGVFKDRLTAAVANYLGLIGATDALGTTPALYASQIINGTNYQIANSGTTFNGKPVIASSGIVVPNVVTATGPTKTSASGGVLGPAGC